MNRMSIFCRGCIAATLALGASLPAISGAPPPQPQLAIDTLRSMEAQQRFEHSQLIVKFRSGVSAAQIERALSVVAPASQRRLHHGREPKAGDGSARYHLVHLGGLWSVPNAIAQLRRDPLIEDVQPDWLLTLQDSPPANDVGFNSMWGMQGATTTPANPYGTGVATLWQQGYACMSTQPVVVAVLDTGIRTTHEDLRSILLLNPGDPSVDGIDNDGDGFIDDWHGWNFFASSNNVEDDHSHGSHVSGTIAARHNNNLGVAGMCGDGGAIILPVKVCSGSGQCPTSSVLSALSYVTSLKRDHGINVVAVNLSLGSLSDLPNYTGLEYFQSARDANIMVAAAAGNNGVNTDDKFMWPASLNVNNILSVGNLKATGTLELSSNFGVNSVDIAAPGSSIYSTVNTSDSAYNWKSGTSMASPHVAGAIALYRVLHPAAGVQETRDALLSSAAVEPTLDGKVAGSRRLDVSHWAWGSATNFTARCGTNLTRKTLFWLGATVYSDAARTLPLRQMGIALTAFTVQGVQLGYYIGKTDDNGQVLWPFSASRTPWSTQFSVQLRTDDGGSRMLSSTELGCYAAS